MDIAYYDELWRPKPGLRRGGEVFWDARAESFNARAYRQDGPQYWMKLFSLLKEKKMLFPGSTVLDIGCGPGKYAVEMARFSKKVMGLDLSGKMLSYAEAHGKEAGLDNLIFLKQDWAQVSLEEQKWENAFDLVFASMCPALNGVVALEKMIRASCGYCFVSLFADRHESIRDRIREKIYADGEAQKPGQGVYACFNLLWLKGFYPEIIYVDKQWENIFTFEEALAYYTSLFPFPENTSGAPKAYIADYLRQQQDQEGLITEQVKRKIAWIYWKV